MQMGMNASMRTSPKLIFAWFFVLSLAILIVSPVAQAVHHEHDATRLHNNKIHISGIGHSENDEDFCTQVDHGTVTEAQMRARIDDALLNQPSHWDGAGNWRIDLWHTQNKCYDYGHNDNGIDWAKHAWIEIEFRSYEIKKNAKWCNDGVSCVSHYNAVGRFNNHTDHLNEVAFMEQNHITRNEYTWRQFSSHEFGHIVGFRDPAFQGDCAGGASIMHFQVYGCNDPGSGPTANDLNNAIHLMDGH